jgi:hypothetical protein
MLLLRPADDLAMQPRRQSQRALAVGGSICPESIIDGTANYSQAKNSQNTFIEGLAELGEVGLKLVHESR